MFFPCRSEDEGVPYLARVGALSVDRLRWSVDWASPPRPLSPSLSVDKKRDRGILREGRAPLFTESAIRVDRRVPLLSGRRLIILVTPLMLFKETLV